MSDIFGGPPDDDQYDPFGYPIDYEEVENPYGFRFDEERDRYWKSNLTLYNDDNRAITMPVDRWFATTMQDPEWIHDTYGMDFHEIIRQMQWEYEVWDYEDWQVWREHYALVYGS
jgi:hypothetical protein